MPPGLCRENTVVMSNEACGRSSRFSPTCAAMARSASERARRLLRWLPCAASFMCSPSHPCSWPARAARHRQPQRLRRPRALPSWSTRERPLSPLAPRCCVRPTPAARRPMGSRAASPSCARAEASAAASRPSDAPMEGGASTIPMTAATRPAGAATAAASASPRRRAPPLSGSRHLPWSCDGRGVSTSRKVLP